MSKLEEIYDFVRKNGPTLPVEVASKIGVDSFLANAYLMQLAETNKLKSSKELVGGSHLYFLSGQENYATRKAESLIGQVKDAKTASKFQSSPASVTPEIAQKREEFAKRLADIEKGETKEKEFLTSMSERIKETLSRVIQTKDEPKVKVQTKIEPETEPLTTTIKVEPAQEIKVEAKPKAKRRLFKPKVDLIALGKEFLENNNAEIASEEVLKKGKEVDMIAIVPSNLGMIKFYVKVKNKGTINEADLSYVYTQGQNRRLPAILITNGKLTKTAQNYLKVIGGLLKVKKLD